MKEPDPRVALARALWNREHRTRDAAVLVPVVEREIANLRPGSALDLGCGSGARLLDLLNGGWRVTGIDWSEEAIARAEQRLVPLHASARLLVADMAEWKADGRFDLVICTFALPRGARMRLALETASQALAPGGTLLVAEWDRSMAGAWRLDEHELFTAQEIVECLHGVSIEAAETRELRLPAAEQVRIAFVHAAKPRGPSRD